MFDGLTVQSSVFKYRIYSMFRRIMNKLTIL